MSIARVAILVSCAFSGLFTAQAGARADEVRPTGANPYQRATGADAEDDRSRWDRVFNTSRYIYGKDPSPFLRDHVDLLPVGRALDIAMGEGRNAVFLAKKGFSVEGVDISEVAIRKAKRLARENKVGLTTINADLHTYVIRSETYDVILNVDYFQRSLIPQIKRGLKRGGIVVYENQIHDQLRVAAGRHVHGDELLSKGELRKLFSEFQILFYDETGNGKNARAGLIARKP